MQYSYLNSHCERIVGHGFIVQLTSQTDLSLIALSTEGERILTVGLFRSSFDQVEDESLFISVGSEMESKREMMRSIKHKIASPIYLVIIQYTYVRILSFVFRKAGFRLSCPPLFDFGAIRTPLQLPLSNLLGRGPQIEFKLRFNG